MGKPPKLCFHRWTNQDYVKIAGKRHYLGVHGSIQSARIYADLVEKIQRGALIDHPPRCQKKSAQ